MKMKIQNCRVVNVGKSNKIRSFSAADVFGESESEFTINAPPDPVLVVTRPNGGEMFTLLTTESISWTSQNAPGPVIIELYRGGSLSRVIASSATNNGLFSWIIPGDVTPGTDYKIRVTSASDGDIFGESNSPFTIAAPLDPALTVTRPDGGELWSLLTTEQIRWSSQDISGLVDIELWKGGVFNRALDAGSADDGVFDWLIAGDIPPGSDFTVRVISTDDSDVFGESVAPFTLVAPPDPVIAITRPNGGESWTVLTTEQIQWSSQDVSGLLIIELWKGGVLNRRLGANETNDGTFNWQIPDDLAPAFDYKIKIISVTDPSVFDESDAPFTVIDPPADPSLTIVRPNGGETWLVLTSESIVWASQDILGLVDIELRRAGFPERVIVTGIADTGVFQWSIPNDVSPGDDYTIRVLSVDDPAVFDESDAPFFITDPGSNEIVVTEPDDILAVAGSDIPVQAELPAGYNPEIREVCFRRAGENVYRCDAMSVSGTTNTAIIPGSFVTERGVDYFYRFVRDAVERTVPSTNASFMPFRVTVPVSAITSPIVIVGRTYSMISVPVVLEDPRVTSVLPGLGNPAVERLLRWNSSADSYEEAPDISSDFSPGNAFWYISSFADEFEVTGARSVDPSQPFDITLPPGFSQIGNPFAFPVAWTDVLGSSAVDFPVSFDASLGENDPYRYNVSIIDPWEGYWVNNPLSESVVIRVRPVEAPPGAASKNASVSALALSAQYVVQLNAALPAYSLRDSQNYLGLADGATDGHDAIDFAEAPGLGNHVRLSIIQDDVRLAGSFKNTTSAGQEWRLEISAELPREFSEQGEYVYVTLTEEGVLPAGFSLFVIDDDNAERIPLIESSFAVIISADYPVRNLRLIVGTDSYASKRSNGVTETPQSIGLEQNYPNPFSSETRIRYQLSKRTLVRLEVFNVLGQRVASLVNQSQDAGWYLTDWDGTDETGRPVASGTYFYRFVTDVITDTKSMVIIR